MAGLTFGAIEAGSAGFTAPRVLLALGIAVVAAAAFITSQARVRHPMLPLQLFRNRAVSISVVIGFAFMVGYYGLPFVFSLYFQQQRGLSALATGALFLPMMLIGAALTPFSARLVERVGAKLPIISGLVLMAAGLVLLAMMPASTPVAVLSVSMALVGSLLASPAGFMPGVRISLAIAAAVVVLAAVAALGLRPATEAPP